MKTNWKHIALIWISAGIGLFGGAWVSDLLQSQGVSTVTSELIKAGVMTGVVLGSIAALAEVSGINWNEILGTSRSGKPQKFLWGTILVIGPMALTALLAMATGWSEVFFNWGIIGKQNFWLGALIVLFFEAVPEEIAFRGFIYGRLLKTWRPLIASAIAVILFVLVPIVLTPLQIMVFGLAYVGGHGSVTAGYLITMILFGSFQQFVRHRTGSVWMGIGFHFAFVYLMRFAGPTDSDIIQFVGATQQAPLQIALLVGFVLALISLVLATKNANHAQNERLSA